MGPYSLFIFLMYTGKHGLALPRFYKILGGQVHVYLCTSIKWRSCMNPLHLTQGGVKTFKNPYPHWPTPPPYKKMWIKNHVLFNPFLSEVRLAHTAFPLNWCTQVNVDWPCQDFIKLVRASPLLPVYIKKMKKLYEPTSLHLEPSNVFIQQVEWGGAGVF